jgi:hypothetical protein
MVAKINARNKALHPDSLIELAINSGNLGS